MSDFEFIEYRSQSWEVFMIKHSTPDSLIISNEKDKTISIPKNDPKLSQFRTHTELLKGAENLLMNINFLDYTLIQSKLNQYLNHLDASFFSFASGHLLFSFYQMMGLDYSQYQGYSHNFFSIAETILRLTVQVFGENPSFVEKSYTGNQKNLVKTGWVELGQIIDWIAGNEDKSLERDLDQGLEVLELHKNYFITSFKTLGQMLKNLIKGRTCLRFFYAFKAVFHYAEGETSNDFLQNLKNIEKDDLKFYDFKKTEEILNYLKIDDWTSFVQINLKVFLESQKLNQKREIIENIVNYFQYIPNSDADFPVLLVKCFEHENLAKSASLFIAKCAQSQLVNHAVLEKIIMEINDVIIIEEYVNIFSSLIHYLDDQAALTFFNILTRLNIQDNDKIDKVCMFLLKKMDLIEIYKSFGKHDAIFRCFKYESYEDEVKYIKYFIGTGQQQDTLEIITSLIRNVDKIVFIRLDFEIQLTESLIKIINVPQSLDTKNKAIEILDFIVLNKMQGRPIDDLFTDELIETLRHKIFNWVKTDIFDQKIENLFQFFKAKLSENLEIMTSEAYFHLFCKLNKDSILMTQPLRIYCIKSSKPLQGLDILVGYFLQSKGESFHFEYYKNLLRILTFSLHGVQPNEDLDQLFEKILKFPETHGKNIETLADLVFGLMGIFPFDSRNVGLEIDIDSSKNPQNFEFPDFYDVDDVRMHMSAEFNLRYENIGLENFQDSMSVRQLSGATVNLHTSGEGTVKKIVYVPEDKIFLKILQEKHYKYLVKFVQQENENHDERNKILFQIVRFFKVFNPNDFEDFVKIFKNLEKVPMMNQLYFQFIEKNTKLRETVMKKYPVNLYESFLILAKAQDSELVQNEWTLNFTMKFKIFSPEHLCQYLDTATVVRGNFLVTKEVFFSENINEMISDLVNRMRQSGNLAYLNKLCDYVETNISNIIDCPNFHEILKAFALFSINSDLNKKLKQKIISLIEDCREPAFLPRSFKNHLICLNLLEDSLDDDLVCFLRKWLFQQDYCQAPKFKHAETISEAYKLIQKTSRYSFLVDQVFADFNMVLENYEEFKSSHLKSKSSISFNRVSLHNFGSTCYINSILQFLNLNDSLVQDILASRSNDKNLRSLQHVFLKLRFSWLSPVRSKTFIQNFLIMGNKIQAFQQMDACELLASIFETCEKSQVLAMKSFEINLQETVFCQNCRKTETKSLNHYFLPLNITSNSLEVCLENYLKEQRLNFDSNCCEKSLNVSEKSFVNMPDYLVFNLNRFSYDAVQGKVVKVFDQCCFPEDFCVIGKKFSLVAVVVHIGSAQEGHYVCLVRQETYWVLLDDSDVKVFNAKDLDINTWKCESGQFFNKSATPYLLMYSRNIKHEKIILNIDSRLAKIFRKNSKKMIFSRFIQSEFLIFVLEYLKQKKFDDFIMNYFFKLAVFSEEGKSFDDLLIELQNCLTEKNHKYLVFEYFSNNLEQVLVNLISIKNLVVVACFSFLLTYIQEMEEFDDLFLRICRKIKTFNLMMYDCTQILNVFCQLKEKDRDFNQIAEIVLSDANKLFLQNNQISVIHPTQPTSFRYFFEILENPVNEDFFISLFQNHFLQLKTLVQRNEDVAVFAKLTAKAANFGIIQQDQIYAMTSSKARMISIKYLQEAGDVQGFEKILSDLISSTSLEEAREIKMFIVEKIRSNSLKNKFSTDLIKKLESNIGFYQVSNQMQIYTQLINFS